MMVAERAEVVVVGGGIAGLGAAALLARGGASVTLLERSPAVGGRAATRDEEGFLLNMGPHAPYAQGAARDLLRELRVNVSGRRPRVAGSRAMARGLWSTLPATPWSLLRTRLLPVAAKLQLAAAMARLPRQDPGRLAGTTVEAWLRNAAPRRPPRRAEQEDTRAALERFLQCLATGDVEGLEELLAEDVVAVSDSGGAYAAAREPVMGRANVERLLRGLSRKSGMPSAIRIAGMNGLPAVVLSFAGTPRGWAPKVVMQVLLDGTGRVARVHTILAPRKLAAVREHP